jgi:hypothetical protein
MKLPELTPEQRKFYEIVNKIRMAWVMLIVVMVCFVGVLVALICAAFSTTAGPWMRFAFTVIDSLLGFTLHQITRHLFPAQKPKKLG